MLRGCWLLTDLDGTLVPTPHKAHGQYLSVAEGPCFASLREWLRLGGNVCVITTADRRVFQQVHVPLQPHLSTIHEAFDRAPPSAEPAGQLLLSMCTGAVLYQSLPSGIALEPGYLTYQHANAAPTVVGLPDGCGVAAPVTCLDRHKCESLRDIMVDIFLHYARDVIFEAPDAVRSLSSLSKRYRIMWAKLLHYLQAKYNHERQRILHQQAADALNSNRDDAAATRTTEAGAAALSSPSTEMLWKYAYLRSHQTLLTHVGIIRKEHISHIPEALRSHELEATKNDGNQQASSAGGEGSASTKAASKSMMDAVKEAFITFTQELLGVDRSAPEHHGDGGTKSNGSKDDERLVPQMILVGMPMKVFDTYFGPYMHVFERMGVTAIAQPNSVVFSKQGIDKSSTVRYLDKAASSSSVPAAAPAAMPAPAGSGAVDLLPAPVASTGFAHCANLRKAVALGDNPHTADHQLTIFPSLRFVSLEKSEQRRKRHEEILKSGTDGTPSGRLMDDRKIPHLHHVGAEEVGTNVFLEQLILELTQRMHLAPGNASSSSAGGEIAPSVCEATFQAAVTAAVHRAVTLLEAQQQKDGGAGGPSIVPPARL